MDDSDGNFKMPIGSQKTVAMLRTSKLKFSFLGSQVSSIQKVTSRYNSKKSSESAEELGVNLLETINQIEQSYDKRREYSSQKTKTRNTGRNRQGVKSCVYSNSFFIDIVSDNAGNRIYMKTSPSLHELQMEKRKPLMRRKIVKK